MALVFKVVRPSSMEGHGVITLETRELLKEWVEGIDFSHIENGDEEIRKAGGLCVGVDGEVVNTRTAFWKQIDEIVERHEHGNYGRNEVEIMLMPQIVGG